MGLAETKTKYLTKVVMFSGHKMTLFSLDGNTWSTRKQELADVIARQEQKRAELAGKKEEPEVAAGPAAKPVKETDDLDVEFDAGYDSEEIVKVENEGVDDLPFSVGEDESTDAPKRNNKRSALRSNDNKSVSRLPLKPTFDRKPKKSEVKLVTKKKKGKSEKILKPKKSSKVVKIKSDSNKKSKVISAKKRKAA